MRNFVPLDYGYVVTLSRWRKQFESAMGYLNKNKCECSSVGQSDSFPNYRSEDRSLSLALKVSGLRKPPMRIGWGVKTLQDKKPSLRE